MRSVSVCLSPNTDLLFVTEVVAAGVPADDRTAVIPDSPPSTDRVAGADRTVRSSGRGPNDPWQLVDLAVLWRAVRPLRTGDVVVTGSPSLLNVVLALHCRLRGLVLIALMHDVVPHYGGVRGVLYRLQNSAMVRSRARVVVFSRFSEQQFVERYGRRPWVVLPLPTPAEGARPRRRPEIPIAGPYVLFFGRRERYKGFDKLPAIADAVGRVGFSLVVASGGHGMNDVLDQLAEHEAVHLIADRVPENELARLVASARAVVCPYRSATQSGVVAYSLALGTPCVVSRQPGLVEQTAGSDGSVVVDDFADPSWVDGLEQQLSETSPTEVARQFMARSGGAAVSRSVERAFVRL